MPHVFLSNMIIIFSVFIDSCIRQKKEYKILFWLYHILYILVISLPISIIPSLFLLIAFDNSTIDLFTLNLYITLFITCCSISIIFINRNLENGFSLPKIVLNSYFIIRKINFKRRVIKSIGLFLIVYLSLLLIFLKIISNFIPENFFITIVLSCFLFIFTMLIYCEASLDKYKRAEKQFLLWTILFCMLLFFSVYSISSSSVTLQDDSITNIVLLFIGLLFNFALVMDKAREFFGYYYNRNKKELDDIWEELSPNYDYYAFMNLVNNKLGETKTILDEVKKLWKAGKKKSLLMNLLVLPLIFLLTFYLVQYLANQYNDSIEIIISSFIETVFGLWVSLFNNDKQTATFFLILAGLLFFFYKNISHKINTIKELGLKGIFIDLDGILFIIFAILFVIGAIFNLLRIPLYINLLFVLFSLLVLYNVLFKVINFIGKK